MSLASRVSALATRVAQEVNALRDETSSGLATKAALSHAHAESDVTSLVADLAGKVGDAELADVRTQAFGGPTRTRRPVVKAYLATAFPFAAFSNLVVPMANWGAPVIDTESAWNPSTGYVVPLTGRWLVSFTAGFAGSAAAYAVFYAYVLANGTTYPYGIAMTTGACIANYGMIIHAQRYVNLQAGDVLRTLVNTDGAGAQLLTIVNTGSLQTEFHAEWVGPS